MSTPREKAIRLCRVIFPIIRALKFAFEILEEKECEKCVEYLMQKHNMTFDEVDDAFCHNCKVYQLRRLLGYIPFDAILEMEKEFASGE